MFQKLYQFFNSANKKKRQEEHLALFKEVRDIITENYAGWFDKTVGKHGKLQVLAGSTKQQLKKAKNMDEAYSIIKNWIRFFEDPHLKIHNFKCDNHPNHPTTLRFFQKDCAVITLPNCWDYNGLKIKDILNSTQRQQVPFWIIDLRSNRGGFQEIMDCFLPYLQTKPIKYWHGKARVTQANCERWIVSYMVDYIHNMSGYHRNLFAKKVQSFLKKRKGTFHRWLKPFNEAYTMLPFNTATEFPKKVVILINRETRSAGEIFLMSAEQSQKVTIMGTNTMGMMDYGFIVDYQLFDKDRILRVPIVRHNWLDVGLSFDNVGFPPQIHLDPNTPNWENIAYQHLKNS